jgi:hypothetical protein
MESPYPVDISNTFRSTPVRFVAVISTSKVFGSTGPYRESTFADFICNTMAVTSTVPNGQETS